MTDKNRAICTVTSCDAIATFQSRSLWQLGVCGARRSTLDLGIQSARGAGDVEESYVLAYSKLGSFRGDASFSTWLTRIALNEALRRLRHERRHSAVSLALSADVVIDDFAAQTPEANYSQRELAALLEAVIAELPDLYRVVFVLREVQSLATAEAAAALEVSEDVVKTRLSRARALLRAKLDASSSAKHVLCVG